MNKTTGRRDHYLPRGYLRGFIGPARQNRQKPLWYFDVVHNVWSEKSVKQIGHRPGFYDFATTEAGFEPADVSFRELENQFPVVRAMIGNNFEMWSEHLDFLLRFAQMMRARSLLFFEEQEEVWRNTPTWTIKEVGADGKTLTLEPMTPNPPPEKFIRNKSILEMQAEIKKGAAWANDYTWALRYTTTPDEPFVVSEVPFVSTSDKPPLMLILPISWRAGLFGTIKDHGQARTGQIEVDNLRQIRTMYRRGARHFLVSPTKLVDL
jgi:hypothetical protein